jgi:hypothetical protein
LKFVTGFKQTRLKAFQPTTQVLTGDDLMAINTEILMSYINLVLPEKLPKTTNQRFIAGG